MLVKNIAHAFINLVFPAECPICESEDSLYPDIICKKCEELIIKTKTPPVSSTLHLESILSCRPYSVPVKKVIKIFKYRKVTGIINIFEKIISGPLVNSFLAINEIDIIVPVPLHKTKLRKRGFNQSELITRKTAQITKTRMITDNLVKIKITHSQANLSKTERLKNLKNSFKIIDPGIFKEKNILLVDDVLTTGATLESCAIELLNSGARSVKGFTLARAM